MKFCFASLRYLWAQEEGPNVKNTAEWQVCWQTPHPADLKKIIPPTDGMCLNALRAGVFVTEYQQKWTGEAPQDPAKKESSNDPNALPYTKDSRLMNTMSPQLAFVGSSYFPGCPFLSFKKKKWGGPSENQTIILDQKNFPFIFLHKKLW